MKKILVILSFVTVLSACSAKSSDEAVRADGSGAYGNAWVQEMGVNSSYYNDYDYNYKAYDYAEDYAYPDDYSYTSPPQSPMPEAESFMSTSGGPASVTDAQDTAPSKIIRNANIDMKTDNFDEIMTNLRETGANFGGYIENASVYTQYGWTGNREYRNYRVYNITIRVPADRFDEAFEYIGGLAVVNSSNQNAQDVSASYYDIRGRLDTKLIEESRVLDMITRAEEINELLLLEERLGEIRTVIEQYQSRLTSIDRQAAYSTIYVYLTEVTKDELVIISEGLGGRIHQAFIRSVNNVIRFFQNAVIFLAGALIPLAIIFIVTFIGYKTLKRALKRKTPA